MPLLLKNNTCHAVLRGAVNVWKHPKELERLMCNWKASFIQVCSSNKRERARCLFNQNWRTRGRASIVCIHRVLFPCRKTLTLYYPQRNSQMIQVVSQILRSDQQWCVTYFSTKSTKTWDLKGLGLQTKALSLKLAHEGTLVKKIAVTKIDN